MERTYKTPPIVWLKVTDFMRSWLQWELGGGAKVRGQRVVSIQHLAGAREVFRMETVEDLAMDKPVKEAMSAMKMKMVLAGLELDSEVTHRHFSVTREQLQYFVPVECPRICLTSMGVLRPWTQYTCLGKEQTASMLRLLRETFWSAVGEFNQNYARLMEGRSYPAKEMIEAFCAATKTPDVHVDDMRREWQRRAKRKVKSEE